MNADRVISKINYEMNAFNESGGREDKACVEGLRRARTYIQQEVLKRKILTHDQHVVLEWLKWKRQEGSQPIECLYALAFGDAIESVIIAYINLTDTEQFQVLAAFAEWGMEQEDKE